MTGDEIHLYEVPVTNLLAFRCSAEPRDLTKCAAMQYNIALILYLYRETSQRESYSDAQHRKILNRTSSTLKDIYVYVLYTHVNSEAHVVMADLLPILQGDND